MAANCSRRQGITPVYLDYAATTPVDPLVRTAMMGCLTEEGVFGNPASAGHSYGEAAADAVEHAREQVANLLGCRRSEIVFTSGATEANNLAIQGILAAASGNSRHVVTLAIEHKSVLEVVKALDCEVTYVRPDPDGVVSPEAVKNALRPDTVLVSVMQVNNETGAVQPVTEIARQVDGSGAFFHVDAAQSAGKLPIDLQSVPIDFLSVSAHKLYGPKGIGCLYIRRGRRDQLKPLLFGGGQEKGIRPGTSPVHQIVGFGKACELANERLTTDWHRISELRARLLSKLSRLDGMMLNGTSERGIPGIINCSFEGIDGESLALRLRDVAVSVGSACTTGTIELSHVLRAMGVPDAQMHGAIRISLGRFTTPEGVDHAARRISDEVRAIRELEEVT